MDRRAARAAAVGHRMKVMLGSAVHLFVCHTLESCLDLDLESPSLLSPTRDLNLCVLARVCCSASITCSCFRCVCLKENTDTVNVVSSLCSLQPLQPLQPLNGQLCLSCGLLGQGPQAGRGLGLW
jgi:hypothetical protein